MLASILLLDRDGRTLRHGAAPSLPVEYIHAIDGSLIGPEVGSCGTAAYSGRSVVVTDIPADPLLEGLPRPGPRARPARMLVDADHVLLGEVLGTFALYNRRPAQPGRA